MQQGFSKFSWALALFCLPSALWPLALLVSPALSENPNLTPSQIDLFSTAFWIYPFVLLTLSGILYRIYRSKKGIASVLLAISFAAFYGFLCYMFSTI
ncbi:MULTISPECIES: DUF5389 family protein [Glaesserella]|uniref:DUF5389 domain-containing protein n=1 Tax=Glaesserella australis TaxID=2094024 RepID=A0A328C0U1_9PAST|nr:MULTISPECIES: DUF5389 family protein [Glaesserella]AUI66901.1 hypothetical protein CJD39_10115 [Glaesserella sp. 15-184]RAL19535.1 hypothetical protein C5N92_02450 [Glaesserella australis]